MGGGGGGGGGGVEGAVDGLECLSYLNNCSSCIAISVFLASVSSRRYNGYQPVEKEEKPKDFAYVADE